MVSNNHNGVACSADGKQQLVGGWGSFSNLPMMICA